MIIGTVILLALLAWVLHRRDLRLAAALCWILLGVIIAGADSPFADVARVTANAFVDAGTSLFVGLGKALGGR